MVFSTAPLFIPLCKKDMSRYCAILLLSLLVWSCGLSEINGVKQYGDQGIWGGPIEGTGSGAGVLESVCYVVAVDYAKGYDWRSDESHESVRCSLVVYADGTPIMKVPVGRSHQVSADSDMHRIVQGHLYTDYCLDGETIIKRDGKFLFGYSGSERICNLMVIGDDVYTLGEGRQGAGFSLRRNGEVVLSREKASVVSPLRFDGDSICFGFCEQIRNAEGAIDRYYSAYGNKVTNLSLRDDMQKVWDVCTVNGRSLVLASLKAVSQPVVVSEDDIVALSVPKGMSVVSCSMFMVGERVGVEGVCKTSAGVLKSAIWLDGNLFVMFDNMNIASVCTDGEGVCCVLNPSTSQSSGIIYRCGEVYAMPKGYSCVGTESYPL